MADLRAPSYEAPTLASVLPSVAASLEVAVAPQGLATVPRLALPPARRAVVVLVDGLGDDLLRRRGGHAPFLRSLLPHGHSVPSGFPSTTATSMGTFGTGLPPGSHGLLGYQVLVPGEDRLLNELSWEDGPVPEAWQPHRTVFELAERAGVPVTRIGPGFFDGSGLTRAALRGGRFAAGDRLDARVDIALSCVRATDRALVYLYWGELDKVGHVHGPDGLEWGEELESLDRELGRLAAGLPADASLTITADHGMISCPHDERLDVGTDPVLAAGVRHVGGEPRALQLYCEPGARDEVLATWTDRLGERALVRTREEVLAEGWFGPVEDRNLARVGDVVVAMRDHFAVVDSRSQRPELLALLGLHGSLTPAETTVPVLHVPARSAGAPG
ncbi:MAG TPA: nucleotide pyrophosphatase/phosphodiesterase family protein [Dermatophilaceae bacterium]|nr:nucleotide pyrophosphatase/phosphodiesterase family protein [Dermatophilaceae bacterium]